MKQLSRHPKKIGLISGIYKIPVVILCGGKGTRIGPLTQDIPKPLIKIGERPILWHVMKIYASQGFRKFILCLGYKGKEIKRYFNSDISEDWEIQFVNTGLNSSKSERIRKVQKHIKSDIFFLAYGDDVADIKLHQLLKSHYTSHHYVTITIVKVVSDFGIVEVDKKFNITKFTEKPVLNKWMNGGFMVVNRKLFHYLHEGELENEVFEKFVRLGKIGAYKHKGKWKAMNTLKDNIELNKLWKNNQAFWKRWE